MDIRNLHTYVCDIGNINFIYDNDDFRKYQLWKLFNSRSTNINASAQRKPKHF